MPNNLEESGYDILSDVVTLTSEEDENDGTTVSLASYDGDTPDDLSSDGGSDESQSSEHDDHALHFGSTISGADSGLTMTGRPGDQSYDTSRSASAYQPYIRSRWWQFDSAATVANVPSAVRFLLNNKIRPQLRKVKRSASIQKVTTSVLVVLSVLSAVWISMSSAGYQWSDGSLQYTRTQPELVRRNAALDSAVSSMVPKSPISFPKLINPVPQFGRQQDVHDSQDPWTTPTPHPLSPEANESDRFQVQVLGCCNMIVTSPFRSSQPTRYQRINVEIERAGEPISFELSHLVEGVKAVTLDAEEAHGEVQVTIWTLSRPFVNQTMIVNMGSPLYKIASWKSFFISTSRKAKSSLATAAGVTLRNMNALADDVKIAQDRLQESINEKRPYMTAAMQRLREDGVGFVERASLSTAARLRDLGDATKSASKQGQIRSADLGGQLWTRAKAFVLDLEAHARSYQRQAKPVDNLVRTSMRSSTVKRARRQAIDLWGRIKNFGKRPMATRIGSGLSNLNAKSLMPWRDYGLSISRGFQRSSGSGSNRKDRAQKEHKSDRFTEKRGHARCGKKEVLAKSRSRGVLRL